MSVTAFFLFCFYISFFFLLLSPFFADGDCASDARAFYSAWRWRELRMGQRTKQKCGMDLRTKRSAEDQKT
jgi:hypothetical protein